MENNEHVAEPLRRFVVFYFNFFEENGGFRDYLCSADTLEEAVQKAIDEDLNRYKKMMSSVGRPLSAKTNLFAFALGTHIVDLHTSEIVWEAFKEKSKYLNYDIPV